MKLTAIISELNPGAIYVEQVRTLLNTTARKAQTFCEMAVLEHLFVRRIGLQCPTCGRIIEEFENLKDIPNHISCEVCEANEEQVYDFETGSLRKIIFYKLAQ